MSKKKPTTTELSLDDFIDGANDLRGAKKARKRTSMKDVLLHATGKLENRSQYSRVLLFLTSDIEDDMSKYCTGTKQAILLYLIRRGLDELIKANKVEGYEIC